MFRWLLFWGGSFCSRIKDYSTLWITDEELLPATFYFSLTRVCPALGLCMLELFTLNTFCFDQGIFCKFWLPFGSGSFAFSGMMTLWPSYIEHLYYTITYVIILILLNNLYLVLKESWETFDSCLVLVCPALLWGGFGKLVLCCAGERVKDQQQS